MIDRTMISGFVIAAAGLAVSAVIVVLVYLLVGGTSAKQEVRLVGIVATPSIVRLDAPGNTQELLLRGRYSDRSVDDLEDDDSATISYSSSNPSVAQVDPSGIVTGKQTGGADISVSFEGFTTTVPVFVWGPVAEVPPFDMTRVLVLEDNGAGILLNRVMLELEPGFGASDASQLASEINGRVVFEYSPINVYLIEFDGQSEAELERALAILESDRRVVAATPDLLFSSNEEHDHSGVPIETWLLPGGASQAYSDAGMRNAWDLMNQADGLSPVTIAIIDAGFLDRTGNVAVDAVLDLEFEDGRITKRKGSGNDDHGNAVASVMIARNNDREDDGIPAESFSGVVTSVEALDYNFMIYISSTFGGYLADIIDMALFDNQIDAVNISMIAPYCDENLWFGASCDFYGRHTLALMDALQNTVFAFIAGNDSRDSGESFPAVLSRQLPNALAVGATTNRVNRARFSNFGPLITIGAPGANVWAVNTRSATGYSPVSGTSLAAPMVAGTAALLRALEPDISPRSIRDLLVNSGQVVDICNTTQVPCPPGDQDRWPVLDAGAAVATLLWNSVDAEIDIRRATPTETTAGSIVELTIPVTNSGGRDWNFHMDGTAISPSGEAIEFEPVQNLIPSGGSHPFKLRLWATEAGDWDIRLEIFKDFQRTMSAGSGTMNLRVIQSVSTSTTGPTTAQRSTPMAPTPPSTPAGVLRADANVLVLADTSGSMEGEKIESLRSSLLDFVGRIDDAGEYVGLIDFDDVITETIPLGPFGTDLGPWDRAVAGLDGDGGTAFYDAVSHAISVLESEGASGRANIIIALTDGFDEDSRLTDSEVISQLRDASVPVLLFALAYGDEYDLPVLTRMAESTGGVAYPATPEDLERLFALLSTLF